MITKYKNIAPSGGDTGTPINLYKRLRIIMRYVKKSRPNCRIIDCGCGEGSYVIQLLHSGLDVTGIEYQTEKVLNFRKKNPDIAAKLIQGDLESIELDNEQFDIALLNEVLEHVSNESNVISEIKRILKLNGILIVFSPNRLYPFETHSVSLKCSKKKLPHYTPFIPYLPLFIGEKIFVYHARNYWPMELRKLVRTGGFKIVESGFVWQTFENISGKQPKFVALLKPLLMPIFDVFEKVPVINRLGVSQYIIAKKENL